MDIVNNFYLFFNEYEGFLPLIFILIFGSIIGSFLNVVIYRIPIGINIDFINDLKRNSINTNKEIDKYYEKNKNLSLLNSSRCPKCNAKIKPWFNIPIIGFLLLRGKCYNCKASISYEYPIIEFLNTLAYGLIYLYSENMGINELILMGSFSLLLAMFVIDLKEQMLPDVLVYPFMFLGAYIQTENGANPIIDIAVVTLVLYPLVYFYSKIRNLDFLIGFGDLKLFIACSAWVGYFYTSYLVLLSCILGLIISLITRKSAIAFGPSIIISFIAIFLYKSIH